MYRKSNKDFGCIAKISLQFILNHCSSELFCNELMKKKQFPSLGNSSMFIISRVFFFCFFFQSLNVSVCSCIMTRFIQMTPQYFFYNLPSSESKDILQYAITHGSEAPGTGKSKAQTFKNSPSEEPSYERCVIQWAWYITP